ncbi:SufS family cysteine desulfurase [Vallitalea okinawensis]|uniref:SufS family cysteine desulfurase n=1 Tax=Vallitalea okinawensis TaxID=2078660 RepID=UPI000CFB8DD0|nr:SufS family cysteine desulfurase [Vallitalea okinawensis]
MNVETIRKDFPILSKEINNRPLIYLDNAATTHKPLQVIEAISDYYKEFNANPHRGAHALSYFSTEFYEQGRQKVKTFIGANGTDEIIFTHNTTEAINMVAKSFLEHILRPDDSITVAISDHHSCLIPPFEAAKRVGAGIDYLELDQYLISDEEIENKIHKGTKMVFIGHVSNVLGTINPIEKIIHRAKEVNAYVLIDGAQAVPHERIDVSKLDVDFYCFSGHKMLGPMGIGVLYGKKELLQQMLPYNYGGNMVNFVTKNKVDFKRAPHGFEAGTQNVEAVYGLTKAIDYLNHIGMDKIKEHERKLLDYALKQLNSIDGIELYGPEDLEYRTGVISFNLGDIHPHDIASVLDMDGIAVRSGYHCAQPLMNYLNLPSTCRASFYLYNNLKDIDFLVEGLLKARRYLTYGH